jgi:hypothetical protein
MPTWLRVLSIVVICGVLIAATVVLLFLALFGGLRYFNLDDGVTIAASFIYVILLACGVFGIFMLAKGFLAETPAVAYSQPAFIPPPDKTAVEQLRYALIAAIALEIFWMVFSIAKRGSVRAFSAPMVITLIVNLVLLRGPYAALLVAMISKVEKYVVAFALTLPCAWVLHTLYFLIANARRFHGPYLIFMIAAIAADVAIFVFALQLKAQLGEKDQGSLLMMTGVFSVIYTGIATLLMLYLPRWLYHSF